MLGDGRMNEKAQELSNRFRDRFLLGDYSPAILLATKLIEEEPQLGYRCRGAASIPRDCPSAIDDLSRAIELDDDDDLAWYLRGVAYVKLWLFTQRKDEETYRQVLINLNTALQKQPNSPRYLATFAVVMQQRLPLEPQLTEKIADYLQKAIKLDPHVRLDLEPYVKL